MCGDLACAVRTIQKVTWLAGAGGEGSQRVIVKGVRGGVGFVVRQRNLRKVNEVFGSSRSRKGCGGGGGVKRGRHRIGYETETVIDI